MGCGGRMDGHRRPDPRELAQAQGRAEADEVEDAQGGPGQRRLNRYPFADRGTSDQS